MSSYHLAQLNIGRLKAPLDSPALAGFVARLADINALADSAPGFLWRLKTEDGDATALRPYADDRIIVNMSLWTGLEALRDFVYRSAHSGVMRQRREWFEQLDQAFVVLWWHPAGQAPTVDQAKERLARLQSEGEGPECFSFRRPFPAPDAVGGPAPEEFRDECPAT